MMWPEEWCQGQGCWPPLVVVPEVGGPASPPPAEPHVAAQARVSAEDVRVRDPDGGV